MTERESMLKAIGYRIQKPQAICGNCDWHGWGKCGLHHFRIMHYGHCDYHRNTGQYGMTHKEKS